MSNLTKQEQATRTLIAACYTLLAEFEEGDFDSTERARVQLELAADDAAKALARLK